VTDPRIFLLGELVMSVVVFGARGFVGSAVTKELARRGVPVISVARSEPRGTPPDGVTFARGNALEPETYKEHLKGARAVVVSIGEPPWEAVRDVDRALLMNGDTNTIVLNAAKEAGVAKAVVVNATMPAWCPRGYKEGKLKAEAAAVEYAAEDRSTLVLKPGVVTGTRYTAGGIPIPLWLAMAPMRFFFRLFAPILSALEGMLPSLLGGCLSPPVDVSELALASADFVQGAEKGVVTLTPKELVGYTAK